MKYTIISIDDSRTRNKDLLRKNLPYTEARINFVNGKDPKALARARAKWSSIQTPGPFKAGEFGIFYSVLNCLEYGREHDGIIYLEDDAIPTSSLIQRIGGYVHELPTDADLLALWSPANQKYDYDRVTSYNDGGEPIYDTHGMGIFDYGHKEMCRLWQGYGNVGMFFTKQGCAKAIEYIEEKGFFAPIDCLICIGSHTSRLNGYSLKPDTAPLIDYNWNAPTTIHQSRWGYIEELIKEES